MRKKCLITGASGLIGKHLLPELWDAWEVYTLGRSHGFEGGLLHHLSLDLMDAHFCEALPPQMDLIVHLAQSQNFRSFPEKALDIFGVNTQSTLQLLDYARKSGVQKFIYASSGVVYGSGVEPFVEDVALSFQEGLGFYYTSKFAAESLVKSYQQEMETVILRPFFVYGPGQAAPMLIPRLVENVLKGVPIQLQGKNGIRINPIEVSDAVRAIEQAMLLQGNHVINVAGAQILSLREIGGVIGSCLDREPVFNVDTSLQPKDLIGCTKKMSSLLGAPRISFELGLQKLVETHPS